jgi:hypothetical protein
MTMTPEEIGYQDAVRQVHRSLQRRLKTLEDEHKHSPEPVQTEISVRISEVKHIMNVVESLHR